MLSQVGPPARSDGPVRRDRCIPPVQRVIVQLAAVAAIQAVVEVVPPATFALRAAHDRATLVPAGPAMPAPRFGVARTCARHLLQCLADGPAELADRQRTRDTQSETAADVGMSSSAGRRGARSIISRRHRSPRRTWQGRPPATHVKRQAAHPDPRPCARSSSAGTALGSQPNLRDRSTTGQVANDTRISSSARRRCGASSARPGCRRRTCGYEAQCGADVRQP